MKSQEYWQKRFTAIEAQNNKTARSTVHSVTTAFDKAQAQIEKELNAWYVRFAKNNEITLQEAKKLLNTRELKEFRWDVEKYIEMGQQNALDQKWLKELENASAKVHISRLEALRIRTQQAAELAFGNELDALDQMAARMYTDDYYHTAYEIQRGLGVGWDIGQVDQRRLDNVLSKPWTADKLTFSDRIWKSKTQLLDSLQTEFTQMCILGKAPDETIKLISHKMNVSKGQAGRLIMTEAAYFSSAAQKDCFNDLDVEKFEVVATLDRKTSETCQHMDGQVFDMKDFQIGVTAPPFHVWCRTCTAPWFEDNNDGERIARDADGKTYMVPADMKYQDWKDHFVDGGSKRGLTTVDKDDNLSTDMIVHLQDTFGKNLDSQEWISKEYGQKIKEKFNSGNSNAKRVFNKFVGKDSVGSSDYTGIPYFDKSSKKVFLNSHKDLTDRRGVATAFFHEHGHYIDFVAGENEEFLSVGNAVFGAKLRKDFDDYLNEIIRSKNVSYIRATGIFESELRIAKKHSVSDIVDGLSNGKILGIAGHTPIDPMYWSKQGALEKEAFAHMFESMFDAEKAKYMSEYFPTAYKEFKKIIKGVL